MDRHILIAQLKYLSKLFAAVIFLLGASTVIARLYLFEYSIESQFPHFIVSISIMLCGASIYLEQANKTPSRLLAHSLAAATFGIALMSIAYYLLLGSPQGEARLLVMPPNTTVGILLLSSAIMLNRTGERGLLVGQIFALTSLIESLLALIGLALGTRFFVQIGQNMPMTAGAGMLLTLLALTILFSRPDTGIMSVLTRPGAGGVMWRLRLSPIILIPALIAWLTYQWQVKGVFGSTLGLALAAMCVIVLLPVFLWSEGRRAVEERAMLETMMETMMDAVIVIDERGIIETANPAAEKAFGYRTGEMTGLSINMIMPSPYREQHDVYLGHYLRTRERHVIGVSREFIAQRKDGSQFPIELLVSEMTIANRRKFTGVLRDISERKRSEEALAQYDQRFRAISENAAVGIAILSPEKRFLYVNRKLTEITGYSTEELLNRTYDDITYPDDIQIGIEQHRRLLAGETDDILIEKRYLRKDGTIIWIDASISCVRKTNGEPAYKIAVIEDISARKAAEEALKKSKQDLDVALDGANIHLWHLDCKARMLSYLDKLPLALGYTYDEVQPGLDFWLGLFHPDDRERIVELLQHGNVHKELCEAGEMEVRLRTRDNQWKWMLLRARIIERDEQDAMLRVAGTCLDITERKESEQKLLHIAQHDPLTGLPNRALTYAFGEHTLASARRDGLHSAVLFIDLDRFKPINDTYGHDAGDAVLREAARRLRNCLRAEDIVGRLGGDEFLIVLADVDGPNGAGRAAGQCIAALSHPCTYKELKLQVSSSIGISLFPADGTDISTLAKHADTAMYHAKECGRDNYQFFTEELNARTAYALNMENRLRNALRQREFQLHYQPIVELDSGSVVGAEALLRWPCEGIPPEQFIPVAEYTGLIHQLGEWALHEACRQQRIWQIHGLAALKMSVNISAAQFRQAGFRGMVAKAVVDSGIDPNCLQLEITENVLVKNSDAVMETLRALKQLGLQVALDDFGKGYSSLASLKCLPVDAIKIDRDFIQDLHADRGNMAITAAIINLGRELGIQVIAEGIETRTALQSLQARRCNVIQGFYVCPPIAGGEFEDWYHNRQKALTPA